MGCCISYQVFKFSFFFCSHSSHISSLTAADMIIIRTKDEKTRVTHHPAVLIVYTSCRKKTGYKFAVYKKMHSSFVVVFCFLLVLACLLVIERIPGKHTSCVPINKCQKRMKKMKKREKKSKVWAVQV
jgi:hypothetical protein